MVRLVISLGINPFSLPVIAPKLPDARLVSPPTPPALAHNAVAWVPKHPELVINDPTDPVMELVRLLVIELTFVKLPRLLSAPDASDPGLVIPFDNKLVTGLLDKENPEVDGK